MDGKMLARLGAVVFVGVAITATVMELTRKPEEPQVRTLVHERNDTDALRQVLRQCRDMGEAAIRPRRSGVTSMVRRALNAPASLDRGAASAALTQCSGSAGRAANPRRVGRSLIARSSRCEAGRSRRPAL